MKIDGSNRIGAMNQYKKNIEALSASAASRTGKKKDQVEISSEAKELLGTQGPSGSDKSVERIAELKSSVAAGTYKIDARTLAEKLFPFIK